MPKYQGEYDGLCGPYAIVNAFEHCQYPNTELIFKTACSAFPKSRWPDLLWKGTTFEDMKKMLNTCKKELQFSPEIIVGYPFEKSTPQTNKEYWLRFDELFENESVKCAIIGQTKPSLHWIVASRSTQNRIIFSDSTVNQPFIQKNRSSIHAGKTRRNLKQWLIDRRELITFSN